MRCVRWLVKPWVVWLVVLVPEEAEAVVVLVLFLPVLVGWVVVVRREQASARRRLLRSRPRHGTIARGGYRSPGLGVQPIGFP